MKSVILIGVFFVLLPFAKIVKMADYDPNFQSAVDACQPGDVLIIGDDIRKLELSDPPSGIQIVGGEAKWTFTKDVEDVVFFDHQPRINQISGKMRRVMGNAGCRGSRFTHIDSCFFMAHAGNNSRSIEVDGFLRASTFLSDRGYMGSSECNLKSFNCGDTKNLTWTDHVSSILINATDPVGDGSGTLIANYVSHGQIDWTPIHIINGRGITVAHLNSEYGEWGDPFLSIENGVECVSFGNYIGGKPTGHDWDKEIIIDDGSIAYSWMTNRWGAWRIGGMNNAMIGGGNYVPVRPAVTGASFTALVGRDPYITKWSAAWTSGINFAPGLGITTYGNADRDILKKADLQNSKGAVLGVACTTSFIQGEELQLETSGLKPKSIRKVPGMHKPYTPFFPRIKLDDAGPGENMTGKSGQEILNAVNSGKTIYLGPGTYQIPGTMVEGTVYGAGMDETIIECKQDSYCAEMPVYLNNLTLKGGKIGVAQASLRSSKFKAVNLRFQGQSICGLTYGNAEQVSVGFMEFVDVPVGIASCADGIPCVKGGKLYDKFNVYNSKFINCRTGASISGGTDGFVSFVGCRFENIENTALNLKTDGNYVAGCEFISCGTAIESKYATNVHNCSVTGTGNSKGIIDAASIISTSIMNCGVAVETRHEKAILADILSDGELIAPATAWISDSKFSNLDCKNSACFQGQNLAAYVDNSPVAIDVTPPTEPTQLKVVTQGSHNVLTWNPSVDNESKIMQYIIERKGVEVGRTNFNYNSDFQYVVEENWGPEGYPGPGMYRNPTPLYVDSGAAGSFSKDDYKIVAVNFAQIRHDGEMAVLRLWPHGVSPYRLTGNQEDGWPKLSDSVYVPLGDTLSSPDDGGRSYRAVAYSQYSQSGLTPSLSIEDRKHNQFRVQPLRKINGSFDILGREQNNVPDNVNRPSEWMILRPGE